MLRSFLLLLLAGAAYGALARGHADNVYAVGFAPDGRTFATGSDDGTMRLWGDGAPLVEGVTSVDSLHFSPDGRWLAAAVGQGRVMIWRGPEVRVLQMPVYRCIVRFSPDSATLAVGARDGSVRLFSTMDLAESGHWDTGHGALSGLSWSPDGRTLAVSSWWDDTASLWDVASRQERVVLRGHTASVYCVAFEPGSGARVATGSRDGTLRLWSVQGLPLDCLTSVPGFIHGLDWSPDGAWIATAHEDSCTRLWDVSTRRVARVIGSPEPLRDAEYSQGVAFSPDSTRVAIGRRWGNVREALVADGRLLLDAARLPRMTVVNLALSPSGSLLAVAYSDATVGVWDLRNRRLEAWLSDHRRVPREFTSNQLDLWPGRMQWVGEELQAEWEGRTFRWDGKTSRLMGSAAVSADWPVVHGVGERNVELKRDGAVFRGEGLGTVLMLRDGQATRFTLTAPEGAEPSWEVR